MREGRSPLLIVSSKRKMAVISSLDEEKKRVEAQIKQMIGDAEEAHTPAGQVYTFKEVITKEYVRKESRYRKFVRKK